MAQRIGMNSMDKENNPEKVKHDFTAGDPEWAFSRETVDQLNSIMNQLEKLEFHVDPIVIFNKNQKGIAKNSLTLEEYQDTIDGLSVMAVSHKPNKNGDYYKVVIETDANDDSIVLLAGVASQKRPIDELWNKGLFYNKKFSKDELGKFSTLWDRVNTNLLKIDSIGPIVLPRKPHKQHTDYQEDYADTVEDRFTKFIDAALDDGVIKRIRIQKKFDEDSD